MRNRLRQGNYHSGWLILKRIYTLISKNLIRVQERFSCFRYKRWLEKQKRISGHQQAVRHSLQIEFPHFTILIIVDQTDPVLLEKTIRSCQEQGIPSRLLVIVGQPLFNAVIEDVDRSERSDNWVQVVEPKDILEDQRVINLIKQSEWVMTIASGDTIGPFFLSQVFEYLHHFPGSDVVFFDEDYALPDGRRQPFLKPDWSPETMLSVNLLSRPVVSSHLFSHLIDQGQPLDFSSEEWVYRVAAQAKCIVHVPEVLYHRNSVHPAYIEIYGASAQPENVRIFLAEQGLPKPSVWQEDGRIRVSWTFERQPFVSIIIPTRDHPELIRRMVTSLLERTGYRSFEILLMDNDSSDSSVLDYYRQINRDDRIRIIYLKEPFNYSHYNNIGAKYARGDVLVFLNNDMEIISSDWLEELVRWALLPEIGAVGAQLLYPDGTIQHAGIVVGLQGHAGHLFLGSPPDTKTIFGSPGWYRNVSALTGACLAIRKAVFESIGGFDERFVLAFNDVEIGIRLIAKGYRNLYNPFVRLIHYEGRSRGKHIPASDIQVGYDKLKDYVARGDPYFNPNLSHLMNTPTLRRSFEETPAARLEWIRAWAAMKGNTNG